MVDTFDHHFIREIYEQPDGLRRTFSESGPTADTLADELAGRIDRVVLVGCGDPHFISYAAARAVEKFAGVPAKPVEGLEFALYGGEVVNSRTLLIAASQSGKTIQVVQALRQARKAGAFTLAVTNSPDSPVTKEAECVMLTRCGLSLSFPTKTTTSALALLSRLAVALGRSREHISPERAITLLSELDAIPTHVETALGLEPRMKALVGELSECQHFGFIGTGGPATKQHQTHILKTDHAGPRDQGTPVAPDDGRIGRPSPRLVAFFGPIR